MKKTSALALLFVLILIISSCSSDDSGSGTATGPKISSITDKAYSNGTLERETTLNFNYANNLLDYVTMSTGTKIDFFYSGAKITSADVYFDNILEGTWSLTYNGDKLMTITNNIEEEKTDYTYTAGQLQGKTNSYLDGGVWVPYLTEDYILNANSNIQQMIRTYSGYPPSKVSYDYDTHNSPFRNMNPYLRHFITFESLDPYCTNNITKDYSYASATSTTPVLAHNYAITYNLEHYPILVKKYVVDNGVEVELISELSIIYTE